MQVFRCTGFSLRGPGVEAPAGRGGDGRGAAGFSEARFAPPSPLGLIVPFRGAKSSHKSRADAGGRVTSGRAGTGRAFRVNSALMAWPDEGIRDCEVPGANNASGERAGRNWARLPGPKTWCPATKEQGFVDSEAPRRTDGRSARAQRRGAPRRKIKALPGAEHHVGLAEGRLGSNNVVPRDEGSRLCGQ